MFLCRHNPQQAQAQTVLTTFQDHPDAWQKVPEILERSTSPQTKYIALQIMDKLIKARWKTLPEDQRSGIRNFIVGVIVKSSSDEGTLRKERSYVGKLNLILVQILKQEWYVALSFPHSLSSYSSLSDLVARPCDSSKRRD